MTMITPSYLGETIEYSSLHACRSTLEDPTELERRLKLSDYFTDVKLLPGQKIVDSTSKQELFKFELSAKVKY